MLTVFSIMRNRFAGCALLLTFMSGALAADSGALSPAEADWTLLHCFLKRGQDRAAAEVGKQPQNAAWHDYCAWAYLGLGSGIDEAQKAVALKPNDAMYLTSLAANLFSRGKTETAEKTAQRANDMAPGNGRAMAVLALCSESKGQSEKAAMLAQDALKASPKDFEMNLLLYQLYTKQRERDQARDAAGRLIAACPSAAIPYMLRGKIERDQKDYDLALADLRRAHELDPNNPALTIMLSKLLDQTDNHEEAIAFYTSVIKQTPDPQLYFKRAQGLHAIGKLVEAEADYAAAIQLANAPDKPTAFVTQAKKIIPREYKICWVMKADLLRQLGRDNEALSCANEILRIDPECDVALEVRQSVLRKQGKYREAIPDLNKLIAMDNDVADWYQNRGEAYSMLRNDKAASVDFARAKHIDEFGE